VHHTGMQSRLFEADSSGKPTSPCNKQFCVGERPSCDGGLKSFGVAHGIGRHEVKVVGDNHSASVSQNDVMWLMEMVITCG
jgi:hypothetical protein